MKRTILMWICLSFLMASAAEAKNVTLNCHIENGDDKFFRLEKISDYVSFKQDVVYSSTINNGNISCSFTENDVAEYILYIDFAQATIFIEPDTKYDINIVVPEVDITQNPFTNRQFLQIDIKSSKKNDINRLINDFNNSYDEFLYNNAAYILNGNKSIHNSFKNKTLDSIAQFNNHYFNVYAEYSFACTELSFSSISKQNLADTYLHNRDVEFGNPMYMQFLDDFCRNTIFTPDKTTTNNIALIELTSIRNFAMFLNKNTYPKQQIIPLLDKAEKQTNIKSIKTICKNLISNNSTLLVGNQLPDIELTDEVGQPVEVNNINKSNKYLYFFKSSITQNKHVLDTLLSSKYLIDNNFSVIPIDLNEEPLSSTYRPENIYEIHNVLGIKEYPFIITIDSNGYIIDL